ncbi:MAG: DUF192 domain-containing protein [Nitrosopumilus sp.]|nr:DUF192 domain-containing protein [Nitrosopumilus sp.]
MVKKITLLIPVIISSVIIGILGIMFAPSDIKNRNLDLSIGTIKLDNKIMNVEVADSNDEIQRWLKFRHEKLDPDSGLLLVYDKPDLYSLWLLNINYPLDLLWFDKMGNLVYTVKNAQPCNNILDSSTCTFKNIKPAKFILATSSGFIPQHNITDNSKLEILSI